MPIPDYQSLMLPLLKAVGDKKRHNIRDLYEKLSNEFNLTSEEREARLPSGRETYIRNRVSWARTYLKKAGLVKSPEKGVVQITQSGLQVLSSNPKTINNKYLRQFPGFVEFRPKPGEKTADHQPEDDKTPEENFDFAYQNLRDRLASELLETIKQSNPYFFEQLVVDLMLAMGYGGSRRDAGEATRKSGDGGVDGVIREDRLGLDAIYLQAKRYNSDVIGEPELRNFAGALQGHRAHKGVFITTSTFSEAARGYTEKIDSKIVLIDGQRLAQLMIDYGIGVATRERYEIKEIDSDYFSEE